MVQALGPIHNQHSPLEDVIKVNVDDSSLGNSGNAGFGGLLRNDMRIWIQVFFFFFLTSSRASNVLAELSAILKGLQWAWDLGYRSILMESDSRSTLNILKEREGNECAA